MSNLIKYPIVRWDAIITCNVNLPNVMIYFKPDEKFLNSVKLGDVIKIKIENTNIGFYNQEIEGVFHSLATYPSSRPMMAKETDLYIILLNVAWFEYPINKGEFSLIDVVDEKNEINDNGGEDLEKEVNEDEDEEEVEKVVENYTNNNSGLSSTSLSLILFIILLIFGVLLLPIDTIRKKLEL